jgi:hypothetical protein
VNSETYKMLVLIERIELHCMNCGTNYDQRSCATCGSVTTRLVREKEKWISFHFLIFASACQKNVQNYYYLVHNWYRLKKSETAIVYVCTTIRINVVKSYYSSTDKNNELDRLYKSEFSHFDDAKDHRRCFLRSIRPTVHIHRW